MDYTDPFYIGLTPTKIKSGTMRNRSRPATMTLAIDMQTAAFPSLRADFGEFSACICAATTHANAPVDNVRTRQSSIADFAPLLPTLAGLHR